MVMIFKQIYLIQDWTLTGTTSLDLRGLEGNGNEQYFALPKSPEPSDAV